MTNTPSFIGDRLKALRRRRGLTQAEFAQLLGVTKETVYRYEHGAQEPSLSRLASIAKCLDTSTDCLLGIRDDVDCLYFNPNTLSLSQEQQEALRQVLLSLRK